MKGQIRGLGVRLGYVAQIAFAKFTKARKDRGI